MKIYIASLVVGVLVGVIYSLVNVRSPAPPTWALVGLLGMLLGEQLIPFTKQHFFNSSPNLQQTSQTVDESPSSVNSNSDE